MRRHSVVTETLGCRCSFVRRPPLCAVGKGDKEPVRGLSSLPLFMYLSLSFRSRTLCFTLYDFVETTPVWEGNVSRTIDKLQELKVTNCLRKIVEESYLFIICSHPSSLGKISR